MPAAEDNTIIHFELTPDVVLPQQPIQPKEEVQLPQMQYFEKPVTHANAFSGSFLNKPANIYADAQSKEQPLKPAIQQEKPKPVVKPEPAEDEIQMQLVIKDEQVSMPVTQPVIQASPDLPHNEEEDQKKRAAERIQKLRNLSFNMNTADTNSENIHAANVFNMYPANYLFTAS